jgi:hypothetical protein
MPTYSMKTYVVTWKTASQMGATAVTANTFDSAVKYVKRHWPGAVIDSVLVKDFTKKREQQ